MAHGKSTAKSEGKALAAALGKRNPRVWVVVADGAQARILESEAAHAGVTVRLDLSSDARLTGGKLAAGPLPRGQRSASSARYGIEPRQSLKQHEKALFVRRVADLLTGGRSRYDQLILVAPARVVAALREALPAAVDAKIVLTRNSDMTWMSVPDILKRLGPIGAHIQKSRIGD
nr:host attachment protein [uncultured Dongia sp.]